MHLIPKSSPEKLRSTVKVVYPSSNCPAKRTSASTMTGSQRTDILRRVIDIMEQGDEAVEMVQSILISVGEMDLKNASTKETIFSFFEAMKSSRNCESNMKCKSMQTNGNMKCKSMQTMKQYMQSEDSVGYDYAESILNSERGVYGFDFAESVAESVMGDDVNFGCNRETISPKVLLKLYLSQQRAAAHCRTPMEKQQKGFQALKGNANRKSKQQAFMAWQEQHDDMEEEIQDMAQLAMKKRIFRKWKAKTGVPSAEQQVKRAFFQSVQNDMQCRDALQVWRESVVKRNTFNAMKKGTVGRGDIYDGIVGDLQISESPRRPRPKKKNNKKKC